MKKCAVVHSVCPKGSCFIGMFVVGRHFWRCLGPAVLLGASKLERLLSAVSSWVLNIYKFLGLIIVLMLKEVLSLVQSV